jgi:phage terminase large subunit-like protein
MTRDPGHYIAQATAYTGGVLDGSIVACHWIKRACQRQADDLSRETTDEFPWVFSPQAAEHVCAFIEMLPHIKGKWAREGALIELDGWQAFILTTTFGWLHRDTAMRRFLEAYLEVARKNAKSTLSSGVALYLAFADGEPGSEVYSAATTREQARIVFDDAKHMCQRDRSMQHALGLSVFEHSVLQPDTASVFRALSAEGSTLDGLNVHGAIIDEFHAHKTRTVYDVIDTARGAREQSLLWAITTAGSNRSGICYERRTHITKILSGDAVDDRVFGAIYTLDDNDDWTDESVWTKANPGLCVSVNIDDLRAAVSKASTMSSAVNNLLTKRFNVWVNADSAWMDMRAWERCARPGLIADDVAHLPCYGGLDLASKVDIAARMRVFADSESGLFYLISAYYLPERAVEMGANSQYSGWARAGHLTVTPGDITDLQQIETDVYDDFRTYALQAQAYDPYQATQMAGNLLNRDVPMIELRPSVMNFSEPMKHIEALAIAGKLVHDGNPITTWMVSNIVCHHDAKDNIYPRKERPENKIDGVVAAIMAFNRAIHNRDDTIVDQAFVEV